MIEVKFEFDIDEIVTTALGQKGIVDTCALDDSHEKKYYVKTEKGGEWYAERLLKKED